MLNIFSNHSLSRLIQRNRLPTCAFLGSFLLTLGGWQYAIHLDKLQAEHKFEKVAQVYQQDLSIRFNTYLQALVGLRGLLDSNPYISRADFDVYIHSVNLIQNFPGIRRIGYAPLVPAQEVTAFEARAQMEGFPNYRIKSSRKAASYFPILYAHPLPPQIQAAILGLNMAALPNRAAAMAQSRDANRPVVTRKISMPSDTQNSPAIGIYLPVYRPGARLQTLTERRNALTGFVFEGFRVEDLLKGVFGQDFTNYIDLKIYDGANPTPTALLYETHDGNASAYHEDVLRAKYITTIKVANDTWRLDFSSKPGFYQANRTSTPAVVLFDGLLTTLLLTGIAAQVNIRRRLAWAKEEQHERFHSLFDQNPYAVFSLDLQGRFTSVNAASVQLAGLSTEELLRIHFGQLVESASASEALFLFEQAKVGQTQQGTVAITHPSGDVIHLHVTSLPIIIRGKITGVFGIAKDITEKMRTEEALRESEARFRAIFERAPVGINELSPNGEWLLANQKLLDIVGCTFDELKTKSVLYDLTFSEDCALKLAYERRVMSGELDGYAIEQRYVRNDGTIAWAHVTRTTIRSSDGRLQYLIGIVQDITERKQAETQIRKQQHLLSTIIDTLPLNLFIRDKQERLVLINNHAATTIGLTKDEAIGKSLAEIFSPHIASKIREHDALAWQTQQPSFIEERILQLGEEKYVMAGKIPLSLENEPPQLLGYSIDITQRKRTEDALKRARDELEDKVRERTEELNHAYQTLKGLSSHMQMTREEERTRIAREVHDEMGGVLTAIKIDISMLKQRQEAQGQAAPPELDRTLGLIDTVVASLRRIITNLRPSILDTLGLWAALEWQLQEFEMRANIKCSFQIEGDEYELDDDRATAIFRIFQEALTNVAKHAQATRLNVYGTANEDGIVIKIRDNGIGAAKERRLNAKSYGILGMQERARIFNGSVRVIGSPFRGTTVSIRFPMKMEAG